MGPLLYLAPLAAAALLPLAALLSGAAGGGGIRALAADLRAGWVLLPLLALMLLSSLWALDAPAALVLALRLAALGACGTALAGSLRRIAPEELGRIMAAFAWGLAAASASVMLDLASGGALVRLLHAARSAAPIEDAYSRGSVFQAVVLVPLGIALFRSGRWRLALLQAVLGAAAILGGVQLAAKLALLAGLAAGVAVLAWPRLRWAVPALLALLLAGLPLALPIVPSRTSHAGSPRTSRARCTGS